MKHSASRALALLTAMNSKAVSSVGDLARQTGISKPSVVRLLAILIEDGYVQRASRTGSYTLTRDVLRLSSGFRDDSTIVQVARPIMDELTAEVGWPTALGLFDQSAMVVRYSTIPVSPLAWYRTTLHMRLPLLGSAMGQVFLAYSPADLRGALLKMFNDELSPAERSEEFFAAVVARRYGLRASTADHPTFSISVPIFASHGIAGALSMTFFPRSMSAVEALARYLDRLSVAAAAIASGIDPSADLA